MDPTRKFSSSGRSQGGPVPEASQNNSKSKAPFPFSISAVGPDRKNYTIPYSAEVLPTVQCQWIIDAVVRDFCVEVAGENGTDIIDLNFKGVAYPPETTLGEIHEKIDLHATSCVTAEFTDVAVAKMRLKGLTGGLGSWAVTKNREICYRSENFASNKDPENFIKEFTERIYRKNRRNKD